MFRYENDHALVASANSAPRRGTNFVGLIPIAAKQHPSQSLWDWCRVSAAKSSAARTQRHGSPRATFYGTGAHGNTTILRTSSAGLTPRAWRKKLRRITVHLASLLSILSTNQASVHRERPCRRATRRSLSQASVTLHTPLVSTGTCHRELACGTCIGRRTFAPRCVNGLTAARRAVGIRGKLI